MDAERDDRELLPTNAGEVNEVGGAVVTQQAAEIVYKQVPVLYDKAAVGIDLGKDGTAEQLLLGGESMTTPKGKV